MVIPYPDELTRHFRWLEVDDKREFLKHYLSGLFTLGIPELYHLSRSLYDRDMDAFFFHVKTTAMVHSTWYLAWRGLRHWDIFRHGGKNIKGMNFHKMMSHKGAAQSRFIVAPVAGVLAAPALAAASAYYYERYVNSFVRSSPPGSQGQWFGPYASGFGTVV